MVTIALLIPRILPIMAGVGSIPLLAEAGMFSFLGSKATEGSISVAQNSQTVPILSTTISPSGVSIGGPELIVSGDAFVSDMGPLGTAADIPEVSTSDEISVYVVKKGDTPNLIAEMFEVSVNTVLWANNIKKGSSLAEGRELIILPISGVKHTVKKGDTLLSIAKQYGADADEIGFFNEIGTEALTVGASLIIPDGEIKEVVKPKVMTKKYAGASTVTNPIRAGYYIRPIKGGYRSQGVHAYNGVDLAAPIGTPIYASASGKVILSRGDGKYNGGFGNYVIISHANGSQTLYAHMVRTATTAGKNVKQGELIGYVGSTGRSTGPHIHFEIRKGPRNPF